MNVMNPTQEARAAQTLNESDDLREQEMLAEGLLNEEDPDWTV